MAEGSLDNGGKAKPTDLYFTAGQQRFVSAARTILGGVTDDEIVGDVATPWRYESQRESLMWDSVDDRLHAYSASDPTKSQKSTNPGAEALAVLGLSMYPCFGFAEGNAHAGLLGWMEAGSVRLALVAGASHRVRGEIPSLPGWCRRRSEGRASTHRVLSVLGIESGHGVADSPQRSRRLWNVRPASSGLAA